MKVILSLILQHNVSIKHLPSILRIKLYKCGHKYRREAPTAKMGKENR